MIFGILFVLVLFIVIFWYLLPLGYIWKCLMVSLLIFLMPFLAILLYSIDSKTESGVEVVMILGAGIRADNYPTQVLKSRLDKGLELFNTKKIKYIIVSGDNSKEYHNEPTVMKNYLIDSGVPASVIVEDFGGRRTMDSCYRVKNYFKVNRVIIISQQFHLSRAKFLCDWVGLTSYIEPAQNTRFDTTFWGYIREIPASWTAIRDSVYFEPQVGSDGTENLIFETTL